jgi:sterol desaturase/sphingolipid hydroxylase (fatty acid hydroxylase superfamily)
VILGLYTLTVLVIGFRAIWKKGKEMAEPRLDILTFIANLGALLLAGVLVVGHAMLLSQLLGWGGSLGGMIFIAYPGLILLFLYYFTLGFTYHRIRKA